MTLGSRPSGTSIGMSDVEPAATARLKSLSPVARFPAGFTWTTPSALDPSMSCSRSLEPSRW
jgi:hypothetical protein